MNAWYQRGPQGYRRSANDASGHERKQQLMCRLADKPLSYIGGSENTPIWGMRKTAFPVIMQLTV